MLDYLAYMVLISTWIFGGAAMISTGDGYKESLRNWSMFTMLISGAALVVCLVVWAFFRVTVTE